MCVRANGQLQATLLQQPPNRRTQPPSIACLRSCLVTLLCWHGHLVLLLLFVLQHLDLELSEGFELWLEAGDELSELRNLRSLTISGVRGREGGAANGMAERGARRWNSSFLLGVS